MKKKLNIGVLHGQWGELVARDYLQRQKFRILEMNVRPVARDRRLEIDIIAIDKVTDTLVFVEVKQHRFKDINYSVNLRRIDNDKRSNIRRAAQTWLQIRKHFGACRFDVVQVYGTPEEGVSEIIHTRNVRLFSSSSRFVNW